MTPQLQQHPAHSATARPTMCLDENLAPFGAQYINAQLESLYKNAKRCTEQHPGAHSSENRRFSILATYVVEEALGPSYSAFEAVFGRPELKFICNHNAELVLKIETVKGPISAESLYVRYLVPTRSETRDLSSPTDSCKSVGFVILELDHAQLLSISKSPESSAEIAAEYSILGHYMTSYLELLQEAKFNSFFSLPQVFIQGANIQQQEDQRDAQPLFDHALTEDASKGRITALHGVSVDKINEYLFATWLGCSLYDIPAKPAVDLDWSASCLAYFCAWEDPTEAAKYIAVDFGAPQLELLCTEEVIIYFDIKKVQFKGEKPEPEYKGWKIAFLMYYSWAIEEDEVTISLDFSRGFHHQSFLSHIPEDTANASVYWERLLEVMQYSYLTLLQHSDFGVLYSRDSVSERVTSVDAPEAPEHSTGIWNHVELDEANRDELRGTHLGGFDQVIAMSQESLNAYMASLYEKAASILKEWRYAGFFRASFKRPRIRLLSDNRAIVFVYIKGGSFAHLDNAELPMAQEDGEAQADQKYGRAVADTCLAFEVKIVSLLHTELLATTSETFQTSTVVIEHGGKDDRVLKHLVLDLQKAQYLPKYSTTRITAEGDAPDAGLTGDLQSLLIYIRKAYFAALCREGLHVISSIPIWHDLQNVPSYAMVDIGFQVYCEETITRDNWSSFVSASMPQPVLVVFGVSGSKTLPSEELPFSTSWIPRLRDPRLGFSHGTAAIAKHVFIERAVLAPLARINALTTLIPVKTDLLPGMVALDLRTWADIEAQSKRTVATTWASQTSDAPGYLKYSWKHTAEHIYRCESSWDNFVRNDRIAFPTLVGQGSPRIQIDGSVELIMESVDGPIPRSARATIKWGLTFTIEVVGSVIKVKPCGQSAPVCTLESDSSSGVITLEGMSSDARQLLEGSFKFPNDADVGAMSAGADPGVGAADGVWQFFYPPGGAYRLGAPAFNDNGDLLLELCRSGPPPAATKPAIPSARSMMQSASARATAFRTAAAR
ncbi:hypothetical protein BV20DRAFT_1089883 [Pilatotrama ljubarskyi]|nr:hypothetical protein BV20DRAFT_1089883 [Pilatotrama ljubarskyi]